MYRTILVACLAFSGTSSAWAAPANAAMPTFRDIEYRYTDGDALNVGREAIAQAIPVGMRIMAAQQILDKAGARCKPMKRDAQTIRCIHNEVTFERDIFSDIQWKTLLHTVDDKVSAVSVEREVNQQSSED